MPQGRDAKDSAQNAAALVQQLRRDLHKRLEALAVMVDHKMADAGFCDLLSGMSRLWRYSVYNQVWIASQRKDATAVAGRREWAKRGRGVRDGEKPLAILAPSRPGGGGWPFLLVEVFDISQTEGPQPPPLAEFNPIKGECPDCPRIEAAADKLDIVIETFDPRLHCDVYGNIPTFAGRALGGKVQVRQSLTPLAKAATLVHEYAHELLHEPGKSQHPPEHSVRETESEATAFVVMGALGYATQAPTYVAWQGGKGRDILRSMSRITAAARAILTAIEGKRPRVHIPDLYRPKRVGKRKRTATRKAVM